MSVFDFLFGTKVATSGAALQLPRKIPLRVEPKSFFANERTFLSWASMATTMGGVSSAMVGFASTRSTNPRDPRQSPISQATVDVISCMYIPVAIMMLAYALFTYEWRSWSMKKKQVGFFDDKVGPITLAVIVLITLLVITVMAFLDYFY